MFDFVVEIDNSGTRRPVNEYSQRKLNYFRGLGTLFENHTTDCFSCVTYYHDQDKRTLLENDSRIVIVAGKVFPTNRAQELYGKSTEMTPNDISSLFDLHTSKIVDYIKGNFSLVIWDKKTKCDSAFIGKSGLLKLYYYQTRHGIVLSTSLDSIAQHPQYKKKINYTAIYEALLFGYPLGTITYFKGIELVDNHSYLHYAAQDQKCTIVKYFDYGDLLSNVPRYNWDETYRLSPILFNKSVDILVEGESSLNVALTGGFDSRTILSRLLSHSKKAQYYSWGATKQSLDVNIPMRISQEFGLDYKWIQLGDDFLSDYSKYAEMLLFFTDGLGNIKRCNQMYSHRLLSSHSRFNVTGAIGSELLRPNNGLDTNIYPAMKDLVFAHTLDLDKVEPYEEKVSHLLTPDLILRTREAAREHIKEELSKYMRFNEPYLNLYNYSISQSLWKFFGQEFHAARVFGYVVTPYTDDDFIDFIIQTPVPSINQHAFERNTRDLKAGQLFYVPIIETNMSKLLDYPTTRGYTPRQLTSRLYPLNILLSFLWSRLYNKHLKANSSFNAREWNKIEYNTNSIVLDYTDDALNKLDIFSVRDSHYSIKKWLMTTMDVGLAR